MKRKEIFLWALLFFLFSFLLNTMILLAQDLETWNTKVADAIAKFPAQNSEERDNLTRDLIQFGPDGILEVCKMLVPPGTGDDAGRRAGNREDAHRRGAGQRGAAAGCPGRRWPMLRGRGRPRVLALGSDPARPGGRPSRSAPEGAARGWCARHRPPGSRAPQAFPRSPRVRCRGIRAGSLSSLR